MELHEDGFTLTPADQIKLKEIYRRESRLRRNERWKLAGLSVIEQLGEFILSVIVLTITLTILRACGIMEIKIGFPLPTTPATVQAEKEVK